MLDLSKNKLAALPENMAVFSRLEQLVLANNSIVILPSSVSTLKCVASLLAQFNVPLFRCFTVMRLSCD